MTQRHFVLGPMRATRTDSWNTSLRFSPDRAEHSTKAATPMFLANFSPSCLDSCQMNEDCRFVVSENDLSECPPKQDPTAGRRVYRF